MQAVRFHAFGSAAVLRVEAVDRPDPGDGEVRLRVAATTFNPVDAGIRGGYLQEPFPVSLPHIPGIEVAGTVDAIGAGVGGVAVGDAVIAFLSMVSDGASAEYVIAPADGLVAAPTSVPLNDAAAMPMVALTAHQALFEQAKLSSGQRILINGAGGVVGGYAVQLAHAAGAHVIATASERSRERVLRAGADAVVDHTAGAVALDVPVDVLLNLARVSAEQLQALTNLVRDGGVVANTVPAVEAPADAARGVRVAPVFVRNDTAQLRELVARVDRGELHIEIAERVRLGDLADVHARSDAGSLSGRVLIEI